MNHKISLELKDGYINVHHKGDITLLTDGGEYEIQDIENGFVSFHSSIAYKKWTHSVRLYVEVMLLSSNPSEALTIKNIVLELPLGEGTENFQTLYNNVVKDCELAIRAIITDLSETLYELKG